MSHTFTKLMVVFYSIIRTLIILFLPLQGDTPLHGASFAGSAESCKVLLLHGAKPNIGNERVSIVLRFQNVHIPLCCNPKVSLKFVSKTTITTVSNLVNATNLSCSGGFLMIQHV